MLASNGLAIPLRHATAVALPSCGGPSIPLPDWHPFSQHLISRSTAPPAKRHRFDEVVMRESHSSEDAGVPRSLIMSSGQPLIATRESRTISSPGRYASSLDIKPTDAGGS